MFCRQECVLLKLRKHLDSVVCISNSKFFKKISDKRKCRGQFLELDLEIKGRYFFEIFFASQVRSESTGRTNEKINFSVRKSKRNTLFERCCRTRMINLSDGFCDPGAYPTRTDDYQLLKKKNLFMYVIYETTI